MSEIPERMFEHDDSWPGGDISFMRPKERNGEKGYRHNFTPFQILDIKKVCEEYIDYPENWQAHGFRKIAHILEVRNYDS